MEFKKVYILVKQLNLIQLSKIYTFEIKNLDKINVCYILLDFYSF